MFLIKFKKKVNSTSFAKDSLWSVVGNVISLFFLLVSGIIIARIVGKDAYGQYGTIKNMMTAFAALVAFGFGYSSTKIISSNNSKSSGLSSAILKIVLIIGIILNILFCFIAKNLSEFLNKPDLYTYFIPIGILMLLKALCTTSTGILAGYKLFKQISICNIVSSIIFTALSIPLSSRLGINGAILDLIIYQGLAAFLCYICIKKHEGGGRKLHTSIWKLLKFTFPIAIHELSHTISSIAVIMVILHYSTYGEYALYTVSTQWNAIIMIIPTLLMNVTLSYLSGNVGTIGHDKILKKMLTINLCCTLIPLILIFLLTKFVASLYGPTFIDLPLVLNICVLSTLFSSLVLVFQSNLISEGRNWNLAIYKLIRDILYVVILVVSFNYLSISGALIAVVVDLSICFLYLLILTFDYKFLRKY